MRRLFALSLSLGLIVAVGCSQRYETRLRLTLDRLRFQQRLNANLNPPEQGPFQELSIYLRTPKPLQPQAAGLSVEEGQFDLAQSFLGEVPAAGAASSKDEVSGALPLRLHVLARVKRARTPRKKGAPPPPEPTNRGDFLTDVRSVLSASLGAEEALSVPTKNDKKGANDFKRLIFKAGNGDTVRAYHYKQDAYDVALAWQIPPGLEKAPVASTGIDLCLQSFAVGQKAIALFQGAEVTDDGSIAGPEGGGVPATGPPL